MYSHNAHLLNADAVLHDVCIAAIVAAFISEGGRTVVEFWRQNERPGWHWQTWATRKDRQTGPCAHRLLVTARWTWERLAGRAE